METTPYSPDTELPTPIEPPIEALHGQPEVAPRAAQIPEGLFVAEALSRQPQLLYEQVAKKHESAQEPFEKILERRAEVQDESSNGSPVVSIGSVVADMASPQAAYPLADPQPSNGSPQDNFSSAGTPASGLASLLASSTYRQAMMMGFLAALVLVALFLFVLLITRLI